MEGWAFALLRTHGNTISGGATSKLTRPLKRLTVCASYSYIYLQHNITFACHKLNGPKFWYGGLIASFSMLSLLSTKSCRFGLKTVMLLSKSCMKSTIERWITEINYTLILISIYNYTETPFWPPLTPLWHKPGWMKYILLCEKAKLLSLHKNISVNPQCSLLNSLPL